MILTFHFPDRWDWCSSFTRQYHGLITAENLLSHLHWWTRVQWYGKKNGRCYAKYEVALGWILINYQKPKRLFSRQYHLCPIVIGFWKEPLRFFIYKYIDLSHNGLLTSKIFNFFNYFLLFFGPFLLGIGIEFSYANHFVIKSEMWSNYIQRKSVFGHGIGRIEN